jgi:prepilin-type N-terminal cleavage/methylation domain-containing protein
MMKTGEVMRHRLKNNKGFTLIEVVAVLIILGILSAVVISRGMDTEAVKAQTEMDTLKGHLRYAQYLAMNEISSVKWGINIAVSGYTLVRVDANGTTSPYNLPGESSATHSIAPFTATTINLLFDEWGSPYNGTTKLAANQPITLNPGSESFTITPETGYIQ